MHLALLARSSAEPSHPGLEGTLWSVARECEALGAVALPMVADLRDPGNVTTVTKSVLHAFDGLDVLVNNASALDVSPRPGAKHISLITDVNVRGTLCVSLACADALRASAGAMVTLSPPVASVRPEDMARHPHYTTSKLAMTQMTLGFAADGIRANCLWPRYTVATAATRLLEETGIAPGAHARGRDVDEVASAVYALASQEAVSGQALFDDDAWPDMPPPPEGAVLDLFAA